MQPHISPSIPSMKFVKFITAVEPIIKNNINKINKVVFNSPIKLEREYELNIKRITVRVCDKYLIEIGSSRLSSTKPTIANGRQNKFLQYPRNNEKMEQTITKTIPPPLGIGFK